LSRRSTLPLDHRGLLRPGYFLLLRGPRHFLRLRLLLLPPDVVRLLLPLNVLLLLLLP
jgi:hypothetical protein